jgi:hypothetical protein
VAVIEAAVHGIAKIAAPNTAVAGAALAGVATAVEPAEIFLIDDASEEGRSLHSSNAMLFADHPALKLRCASLMQQRNLRFVNTELVQIPSSDPDPDTNPNLSCPQHEPEPEP